LLLYAISQIKKDILTILVAVLLLSTASSVVLAGQDNSLIGTLLGEYTFHPDISMDPGYNE